jgi:hypothetical protein
MPYLFTLTPFPVPPKREAKFLLLPPWGKVGKGVNKIKRIIIVRRNNYE